MNEKNKSFVKGTLTGIALTIFVGGSSLLVRDALRSPVDKVADMAGTEPDIEINGAKVFNFRDTTIIEVPTTSDIVVSSNEESRAYLVKDKNVPFKVIPKQDGFGTHNDPSLLESISSSALDASSEATETITTESLIPQSDASDTIVLPDFFYP